MFEYTIVEWATVSASVVVRVWHRTHSKSYALVNYECVAVWFNADPIGFRRCIVVADVEAARGKEVSSKGDGGKRWIVEYRPVYSICKVEIKIERSETFAAFRDILSQRQSYTIYLTILAYPVDRIWY